MSQSDPIEEAQAAEAAAEEMKPSAEAVTSKAPAKKKEKPKAPAESPAEPKSEEKAPDAGSESQEKAPDGEDKAETESSEAKDSGERGERRPKRKRSGERRRRSRNRRGDKGSDGDQDGEASDGEKSEGEEGGEEKPRKTRKQRYLERKEKERAREAAALEAAPAIESEGIVEISPKGFGFLREKGRNFQQSPKDVFITPEVVRIFGLRDGLMVKCVSKQGLRGPQLIELLEINGHPPDEYQNLPYFEELTAINPDKKLTLETSATRATTRVIDLIAPIGRGQRGLIVAPPRTGKTTLLHHIAEGIIENYDEEIHLMVLLVDERPEEVTDFQRSFPDIEVFSSSNDSDGKDHTRIALLAIERAKRLVEAGEHVFILMDSITRLARAFNSQMRSGKRGTLSQAEPGTRCRSPREPRCDLQYRIRPAWQESQ